MNHVERFRAVMAFQPVDRLPIWEWAMWWDETIARWRGEGHLRLDEDYRDHFDLDTRQAGWLNSVADVEFKNVTLEEDEDTVLGLDGNGARLRWYKKHEATPEHVGFSVTDREGWEAQIKPHLLDIDRRRIPFEDYRNTGEAAVPQPLRVLCDSSGFDQTSRPSKSRQNTPTMLK